MHAATIDTGDAVAVLRQVGTPETVDLDTFAGNVALDHAAQGFREVVRSISVELAAGAGVADRFVRVAFATDPAAPFAEVVAPFAVQANRTSRVTFAVGVQQAGATNAASIVAPLPELELEPGELVTVDVIGGLAADSVQAGRLRRELYRLVELEREQ